MIIGKLKLAPVCYTVAQASHNALLALPNLLPAIQDKFRKAGYPDYQKSKRVQVQLVAGAGSNDGVNTLLPPQFSQVDRYDFTDTKGTSSFALLPDSVAFETTAYDTSDQFFAELMRGVEIVSEAASGLAYVSRLGVRYVDAIAPRADEAVHQYLTEPLLGLGGRHNGGPLEGAGFRYSYTESNFSIDDVGEVTAKSVIQKGALALPADLTVRVKIDPRFTSIDGTHALLDTDAFWSQRMDFNAEAVRTKFLQLHELAKRSFRAAVTDHALSVWRGNDGL